MRIVREYFGLERTPIVYDNEISGAGGNADEFYVVAEVGKIGATATRTTVKLTHDEMTRMLAEYRRHYPIDSSMSPPLIGGPSVDGILMRIRCRLSSMLRFRCSRRSAVSERQDTM